MVRLINWSLPRPLASCWLSPPLPPGLSALFPTEDSRESGPWQFDALGMGLRQAEHLAVPWRHRLEKKE